MTVKLLTEHHLEFLSLTGGWTGSSESTHVKMPHVGNHVSRLNLYRGVYVMMVVYYFPPLQIVLSSQAV